MDQAKLSSFAKSVVMATSSQQDLGEGGAKGEASAVLLAANGLCDTFSDGPKKSIVVRSGVTVPLIIFKEF